jgi:hypothetical protein
MCTTTCGKLWQPSSGSATQTVKRFRAAGLLCLKTAKSGGKSSLASSVTIHNELLKRDPHIIKTLVRDGDV